MKRRKFIQKVGAAAPALSVWPATAKSNPALDPYQYPYPKSFEEAKNEEGYVAVRIALWGGDQAMDSLSAKVSVKHAKLMRVKSFHFEPGDLLDPDEPSFHVTPDNRNQDVLVLWLDELTDRSRIQAGKDIKFDLGELLASPEVVGKSGEINWSANLLYYHEIGEVNFSDLGIQVDSNDFCFVAMADPQGGNPYINNENLKTRMRIHNAFIEDSVNLVKQLNCDPKFTMVIGDITDGQGQKEDFDQMNAFLNQVDMPLLYSIGNHETRYQVPLGPGYNMDGFSNYFAAQKAINGLEKLLYSFNLGRWHFVVWPDPLRANFFETHPHYFDWLERDLEKYQDRPVMFFQHVPIQPIGVNPMISYTEDVGTKKELLNILGKHGNVKLVLSGHVHIPVKSSFKTAVEIEGINFINLPAAGYRPRAFGEADYNGGPTQGIAVVEIQGEEAEVTFKTVTLEEYKYPQSLPKLNRELYSLEFNIKTEVPSSDRFINGDFQDGLDGWGRRFLYMEDEDPSNICRTETMPGSGQNALYLFTKIRSYQAPGQDRWPQNLNRVYQSLEVDPASRPAIQFQYQVEQQNTDLNALCGAYVLIEGYAKSTKKFNIMYCLGKGWFHIDESITNPRILLDLADQTEGSKQATLNIPTDFDTHAEDLSYSQLQVDKLFITLGAWSANDGENKSYGVYFTGFNLQSDQQEQSNVNGNPLRLITSEEQWYRRTKHVAGEHWYVQDRPAKYT